MSKEKKSFQIEDFAHVNDALIKKAGLVVADKKARRFSTSLIYQTHNKLFKLNEVQQNCESCLVLRADKIEKFYEWYGQHVAPKDGGIQMPVVNAGTGAEPEGGAAQATHDLEDGRVLTVLADGSVQIDGTAANEGAFTTKDGTALAVLDGKLIEQTQDEPLTLAEVLVKYGITFTDEVSERAALGAVFELAEAEDAPNADERALLQARYDELPAVEVTGADTAKQILLQKIDKDDYTKTEGDPFYAAFSASEADALKGKVVETEGGKAVKPGTYATEDTAFVLKVSVGGAATYTAVQ